MALDWDNPKPSDPAYLKEIFLAYTERLMVYNYFNTMIYDPFQGCKASPIFTPYRTEVGFSKQEYSTLCLYLMSDIIEGSPAALRTCANILLKHLTAGHGLEGYYMWDGETPPPANWYKYGGQWSVPGIGQPPNTATGNPGSSIQRSSAATVAAQARWTCNQITHPIMLDGDAAKEIWRSMYRALHFDYGYISPPFGGEMEENGQTVYTGFYKGTYSRNASAEWQHIIDPTQPPQDASDFEKFVSCAEAWGYAIDVPNHTDDYYCANYYGYGGASSSAGFSANADFTQMEYGAIQHDYYEWQEPTGYDENGNPTGYQTYSYDGGIFYAASGATSDMQLGVYFPYTPDGSSVAELQPPDKVLFLMPPYIDYYSNSTTAETPPSGAVAVYGGVAAIGVSADGWAVVNPFSSVAFNSRIDVKYGDGDQLSDLPSVTPEVPASGTATKQIDIGPVPNTSGMFLLKPKFIYCAV